MTTYDKIMVGASIFGIIIWLGVTILMLLALFKYVIGG